MGRQKVLLSIDWDFYAGTAEHVFDSPFWGTPDQDYHRTQRWQDLAVKRGNSDLQVLEEDFPLYGNPQELLQYRGIPAFVALSHDTGWGWAQQHPGLEVLNVDSHHDLFSLSGNPGLVRPGNWAGLALREGLISSYTCLYPDWHREVRVTEGFDLQRTWEEISPHFAPAQLQKIRLERGASLPDPADVVSVLLVQSPAWTNPLFDGVFLQLARELNAVQLSELLERF